MLRTKGGCHLFRRGYFCVPLASGSFLGGEPATASRRPKALKCIMPAVIPLEGYTGEVYPGGIYLQGFMNLWSGGMYGALRNQNGPGGTRPTAPVPSKSNEGWHGPEANRCSPSQGRPAASAVQPGPEGRRLALRLSSRQIA